MTGHYALAAEITYNLIGRPGHCIASFSRGQFRGRRCNARGNGQFQPELDSILINNLFTVHIR